MSASLASLLLAAIAWIAIHIGVAGTALRGTIVRALGEGPFRGLFVLASFGLIFWLASAYHYAGAVRVLWVAPHWLIVLCMLLMIPALAYFVGAVTVRNPTAVSGEKALGSEQPARGILRVTRHPMLWAFAAWATVHIVMFGTVGALMFFGAFLVVALAGMPSIDAKIAKRDPQRWEHYARVTSVVPFAAIAQGRNHFVFAEIGWWRVGVALALWWLLITLHGWLFHIPAWQLFLGS